MVIGLGLMYYFQCDGPHQGYCLSASPQLLILLKAYLVLLRLANAVLRARKEVNRSLGGGKKKVYSASYPLLIIFSVLARRSSTRKRSGVPS